MPLDWTGVAGKVADDLNEVIIANEALEKELARVSRVVGKQGELSQRAVLGGWTQSWSGGLESVNSLIDALVRPTSEMQRVIGAVADGDLSKKVSADVSGEMLELKNTINAMVDQLNGFISEVSRVAREVGTEGKLGQAAAFTTEVGGVWKDLTDNVNLMAGNLTGQVRNIAEVTTAVANGDLSKKISIDVKGEFLELKNTVNAMVDQLKTFSGEVTRVAREVGVEGKLGGQAQSKEVGGVWKDLTDNVNQLAANLTNQVRAIAEVATAVTEGDLTRQVRVEASGEVAVLKDKLNEMIRNLRETTRQNVEQDWLKTNRERFTRMLQGQDDLTEVSSMILSELATLVSAQHGVFYTMTSTADHGAEPVLEMQAGYGYEERKHLSTTFRLGEGLVGQCAKEKKRILLTDVPGDYVRINSGLGEAVPLNIIVLPVLFEGSLRAVVELASFSQFSVTHQAFLDSITESVGIVLNTIQAAGLTEALLKQSQSQAEELRSQQEELRGSNADLARQASLLAEQNVVAEQKNLEVEESKRLIEEKVSQLAVSSKYKSEFIANMSHELRTPLNSLLILAQQLEDNPDRNLTDTQVEYASVIHSSGNELLELLNSILDLAKVESGTVVAENERGLPRAAARRPAARVRAGRPEEGARLHDRPGRRQSRRPWSPTCSGCARSSRTCSRTRSSSPSAAACTCRSASPTTAGTGSAAAPTAPSVMAFAVSDTGIGIDDEQQKMIFEAFAQGDGTTSRLYGGTGLGLSISRELVGLLGGAIDVVSTPGRGSTFTVQLPIRPHGPGRRRALVPTQPDSRRSPRIVDPVGRTPPVRPRLAADRAVRTSSRHRRAIGARRPVHRGREVPGGRRRAPQPLRDHGAARAGRCRRDARGDRQPRPSPCSRSAPDIDIVLMDIIMPVMDGYDAIRAIRDTGLYPHLRVVAVTGKVMAGERKRCLDAGADGYVPKPVDTAELFAALRPWLPLTPRRAACAAAPDGSVADGSSPAAAALRPPDRHRRQRSRAVKILVVDDDFRNIFAMTALLERGHATVTGRRERRRGDRRPAAQPRHRHRADGHHDAGHGRLRHDPGDPEAQRLQGPPDRRGHRQGRGGRARNAASTPGPTTTSPSRSTPASSSPP